MDDIISRQDTVDVIASMIAYHKTLDDAYWYVKDDAPSAQPERIKGKWIHDGYDIPHGVDWMHCSVCGRREPHVPAAMTNYCPTCGSDMRGDEDVGKSCTD